MDHVPELLAEAIEFTCRDSPLIEQLQAYSSITTKIGQPDELAIAWAFRMRCHARLGQFVEANDARQKARQYYAGHLKLEGDVLSQYLADAGYVDTDIGLSDIVENPWLYYVLGQESSFASSTYMMQGDSEEERNNHAMRSWTFFADDKRDLLKLIAVFRLRAGHYRQAAETFDRLLKLPELQTAERMGDMSCGAPWIWFLAGNCYKALEDRAEAMNRWQQSRSFESWRQIDAEGFAVLAGPWIEKAKAALVREGLSLPPSENSASATRHLATVWQWTIRAEAEVEGLDLYQLGTKLKKPNNNFHRYVAAAEHELQNVERFDPFVRTEVTSPEGGIPTWISYPFLKGSVLHYWGFVNLGVDDFERAITAFKEALKFRPSLASYLWMAFCYQGKGDNSEARRLYDLCISGAPELVGLIEDDEERESIKQMAILLSSELPVISITHLYLHMNGQQHGPYPIAQVQGWLEAGQVREGDLAWYEGAANWAPLSSVPGIRF